MPASENAYPDYNDQPHPATVNPESFHIPVNYEPSEQIDKNMRPSEEQLTELKRKRDLDLGNATFAASQHREAVAREQAS